MFKLFIILGALNAFVSVALGAFGAHGLKSKLSEEMMNVYQTGVHYQMIHALGLIAIAILSEKLHSSPVMMWSGWLMFVGIVFFSGSLYALSLSGMKTLGAITPIGGVAFLAAWILLIVAAAKAV